LWCGCDKSAVLTSRFAGAHELLCPCCAAVRAQNLREMPVRQCLAPGYPCCLTAALLLVYCLPAISAASQYSVDILRLTGPLTSQAMWVGTALSELSLQGSTHTNFTSCARSVGVNAKDDCLALASDTTSTYSWCCQPSAWGNLSVLEGDA